MGFGAPFVLYADFLSAERWLGWGVMSSSSAYHLIHALLGLMYDSSPALLIQNVEVSIGDHTEDLDNHIVVDIQPCHL